jgi:hypothetical protein
MFRVLTNVFVAHGSGIINFEIIRKKKSDEASDRQCHVFSAGDRRIGRQCRWLAGPYDCSNFT